MVSTVKNPAGCFGDRSCFDGRRKHKDARSARCFALGSAQLVRDSTPSRPTLCCGRSCRCCGGVVRVSYVSFSRIDCAILHHCDWRTTSAIVYTWYITVTYAINACPVVDTWYAQIGFRHSRCIPGNSHVWGMRMPIYPCTRRHPAHSSVLAYTSF